ncbi:MAG: kynureninase [Deltaproteobacteria bacterium]|nr:kynureninase [Deltaproteobacteria bacterium]
MTPRDFLNSPNRLAPHYSEFRVGERYLLTGHSHQAWPDCARQGQREAWQDAADSVDEKWPRAFEKAEQVRRGFAALMDDPDGLYALGSNTHELLIRFLSALPLKKRPRLVTTDGEFHTIRRQLCRLEEEGLEVIRVPASPVEDVAQRLRDAITDRTAAVLVSSVFFGSGRIVHGLGDVSARCLELGCELLVDTYHSLNVAPFSVRDMGLGEAFAVGGGYKYCQLGEGNCFLRVPPARHFRPVITGWFSEFSALGNKGLNDAVSYGQGPDAFAGSTYDPTSHYRAARVFDFFTEMELSPRILRQVSQLQIEVLQRSFDDLDLPTSLIDRDRDVSRDQLAGFLALTSPWAEVICQELRALEVRTDFRGNCLRLGPAPYLSKDQLLIAMQRLGDAARKVETSLPSKR